MRIYLLAGFLSWALLGCVRAGFDAHDRTAQDAAGLDSYTQDKTPDAGPTQCERAEDCDDGNACTVDRCEKGQCHRAAVRDGMACDDETYCTEADRCSGGRCLGTPRACLDPASPCEKQVCNETLGRCEALALGFGHEDCSYEVLRRADGIAFRFTTDGGASWSEDRRISGPQDTFFPGEVRVAHEGQRVYVVWVEYIDNNHRDIYFNFSADGGNAWAFSAQAKHQAQSPVWPRALKLDVDDETTTFMKDRSVRLRAQDKHVMVTWRSSANGSLEFRQSPDGGETWGPEQQIGAFRDFGGQNGPEMAAFAGGDVAIIWPTDPDTDPNHGWRLHYNISRQYGISWQWAADQTQSLALSDYDGDGDTKPDDDSGGIRWYKVSKVGRRALVVVEKGGFLAAHGHYADGYSAGVNPDIHFVTLDFGKIGADGLPEKVTQRINTGHDPHVGFASSSVVAVDGHRVFVAWLDRWNGTDGVGEHRDVYANYSLDEGTTWLPVAARIDGPATGPFNATDSVALKISARVGVATVNWKEGAGSPWLSATLP